jgi:diguanylate cyclase (GGDEF)-like protein
MDTLSAADRAQVLSDATAQFWQHIQPIVQIALAIHVLLFALFLILDIVLLYAGNAISLVTYIACLLAIRVGHYRLAGMLICLEIILHAILATWVLGWDSNFYFYLFFIVPILAFSFQTAPIRRIALSIAILLVLVGGYCVRHRMGGTGLISPKVCEVFGVVNALTATAMLLQATALSVRYTLKMQYDMYQRANRDSLTNLYTRRRVAQRIEQLLPTQGLAMLLLDIDHFKRINDRHGHQQGDQVLQQVAAAIAASVRASDLPARWGGEEFLILMPDTRPAEARQVAERVRLALSEIVQPDQHPVTATLALAQLQPGEAFREALNRADQALYLGKQQGRDRIVTAD